MTHKIVKLTMDDDRVEIPKEEQVWHLGTTATGDPIVLCSGEFYGEGQSSCEFKEKVVEYGGITCKNCLELLKEYKSIKLIKPEEARHSSQA
jgi:hypothetical protein